MEVLRLDFNGSSTNITRTAQGFLRVNARLTKTGIFTYDNGREYRSEEEVFRADSLDSVKGAPVTDLHPSEKSADNFLTPANAKQHIIGITESVERDGPYLKGSLIIFHEDAIKAIESGERKEISLGYKCRLEPTEGVLNGEAYDAIQRDIVINHVAIGPKGWGRAGAECSIRTDSQPANSQRGKLTMTETIRIDGVDISLTPDSISALLAEQKRQEQELKGQLDAVGLELEKAQAAKRELLDPKAIDARVQARFKLVETCRRIVGDDAPVDGKTDDELKLLGIKKFYPDLDLTEKDQSYIDGMFAALVAGVEERNDSLTSTRQAMFSMANANSSYEKWIEQSAKLWTAPLTGSAR
jgi:uncharacterized protein